MIKTEKIHKPETVLSGPEEDYKYVMLVEKARANQRDEGCLARTIMACVGVVMIWLSKNVAAQALPNQSNC